MPYDARPHALQTLIEDGLNSKSISGRGPLTYRRTVYTQHVDKSLNLGPERDDNNKRLGASEIPWESGVGRVNVTTDGSVDDQGGRCWNITFSSAIGAVAGGPLPPLVPVGSTLSGTGASVNVETLQSGNSISGSFSLKLFGGKTPNIPFDASAAELSDALMEVPSVSFVRATRTNPAANCADGLCRERNGDTASGRTPGGGLKWTVELATRVGNKEPSSPTVDIKGLEAVARGGVSEEEGMEGSFDWPQVVGYLEGEGTTVEVRQGWSGSLDQLSAGFNASRPFSIALGGAGASHGKK